MKAINGKLSWELDESFVSKAVEMARETGAVTLDIFDTALTRLVDSPNDLFAIVEAALIERVGALAKGFAEAREESEAEARRQAMQLRGAEEIDVDDIYAMWIQRMPAMAPHRQLALSLELEAESAHLVGVPDILEVTRRLGALGLPYAFVSDMYLRQDFLASVLTRAGYRGWAHLLISSETGRTKASGRQWQVVRKLGPAFQRVLHIGDDIHADATTPIAHGMSTLVYARARSERRVGAKLTPALMPYSLMRRETVLRRRDKLQAEAPEEAFWFDLGQVLGGIVLAAYLQWLAERVRTHKIDRLYFCSRDGGLVLRGWEAAGLAAKAGVPSRYFYIARRPLNLAAGFLESTPDRLSPALLEFLTSIWPRPLPLDVILRRSGLEKIDALVRDLVSTFGSLTTPLWHEHVPLLREVMNRHAAQVHARLEVEFDNLRGYLAQEQFDHAGRIGMVDMGWHASMQRSLRRIVRHGARPMSLVGFYYGLWPAAQSNRFGAGVIEAAFSSEFMRMEEQPEMAEAVAYLEELHSARHGTVLGYVRQDGRWMPVCAKAGLEAEQFDRATRHFQAGAIETVGRLFRGERAPGGIRLDDLGPDAVRAALGATFLSPSEEELRHLATIGHCATFDHSHIDPLVPASVPTTLEQLRHEISVSEWKTGSARSLLSVAPTAMQGQVRATIQELLAHRGGRYLRQFA